MKKSFVLTGRRERDEQSAMFVFKKSSAQRNGSVYSLNTKDKANMFFSKIEVKSKTVYPQERKKW